VGDSRSTDRHSDPTGEGADSEHSPLSRPGELFRSLAEHDRLATVGALLIAGSMLLPWYGVTVSGGLVKTGFNAFGLVQAALLLTVGSALVLIMRTAWGFRPPRPLHAGTLLALSGVWSALLIVYRIADRPEFDIPGVERVALRYGIFVALAGAGLLFLGGLRRRREEIAAERAKEA
jgi:hypothetical protein